MAYIEEEMRKRRGKKSDAKNEHEDEGPKPSNPQDELFQAPDHLKVCMNDFNPLTINARIYSYE
jgi:hypothetical protein